MSIHSCAHIVPFFRDLSHDEVEELNDALQHTKLKKNETLFRPGEVSDTLYVLSAGEIHLIKLNENGKEQLVSVLNPGDFIGELSIITRTEHGTLAVASKPSALCMLSYESFQRFLMRYPQVAMRIMEQLSQQLQNAQEQTLTIATDSVQNRIGRYLLEQDGTLTMKKKDLASFLGTTPESVSRTLKQFEENGAITKKTASQFVIQDPDLLITPE